ncbi:MAG: DUF4350 domain-containing protein [Candidatus Odinarchaeia archaeon]
MAKPSIKLILFLIIFIFSWTPLVLSLIGIGGVILTDYSMYNTNWNGVSTFRSVLEENGYQVKPVISSLSSINRITESSVLVIIGPSSFYDPLASTSIIDYLNKGNNVIIADDFGAASEILLFLGLSCSFSGQLLLDAGSYDKNVSLPIITSFSSHEIFQEVNSIQFNYATAIAGSGFTSLAQTTPLSWLDQNSNYQYDEGETIGPFTVIASVNYGNGTIILISDPTIFNNDMITRADNLQFALNLINWATDGDSSYLVIFDEGHRADFSSATYLFGLILGEINWISSHWIIAPIYPLFSVYLIKTWLPKRTKKPIITEDKRLRKGYFATKIEWYRVTNNYNKAINILFKKFKKDVIKMYKLKVFDVEEVASKISEVNPKIKKSDIKSLIQSIELLSKGDKIIADKDVFLRVFSDLNKFRESVGLK